MCAILFCTDFSMVAIIVEKTKKSVDESSAENEPAARATTAKKTKQAGFSEMATSPTTQ